MGEAPQCSSRPCHVGDVQPWQREMNCALTVSSETTFSCSICRLISARCVRSYTTPFCIICPTLILWLWAKQPHLIKAASQRSVWRTKHWNVARFVDEYRDLFWPGGRHRQRFPREIHFPLPWLHVAHMTRPWICYRSRVGVFLPYRPGKKQHISLWLTCYCQLQQFLNEHLPRLSHETP